MMRKTRFFVFGILLLSMIAIGCATMPIKEYRPLTKTNEIFVGETKIFKGIKISLKGIKDLGTPADNDPYYQEVVKEYIANLKTELRKKGFLVVEEITPDYQGLVIKTKIGDYPPPLGGWLGIMAMGYAGARVEIYQNNELILMFEEAVNTGTPFSTVQIKGQIKRHIIPQIIKKLSERFL